MTGSPTLRPTIIDMRAILRAARTMEDSWGATLELCLLTLALPWEVVAIDLEAIDWQRGVVAVPARGGAERVLALGHDAQKAVLRIAGAAGGRGQVVTAGRGPRLAAPAFRLDRLLDRLAVVDAATIDLKPWNFHGIREAVAALMAADGAERAEIDAVIGRQPPNARRAERRAPILSRAVKRRQAPLRGDAGLASLGAERWARLLLAANSSDGGEGRGR